MSSESFTQSVLEIVRRIPKGKVLTYGQVATLAGVPRAARIVGGVLFNLGPESKLPWQRVINSEGKLSTYRVGMGERQRELLEGEGVVFDGEERVDFDRYQWWPGVRELRRWELEDEVAYRIQARLRF